MRWLRFTRRCRDLGFTLDQVRDLPRLSSVKIRSCYEVDRMTKLHLTAIEEKIGDLTTLAAELRQISTGNPDKAIMAGNAASVSEFAL